MIGRFVSLFRWTDWPTHPSDVIAVRNLLLAAKQRAFCYTATAVTTKSSELQRQRQQNHRNFNNKNRNPTRYRYRYRFNHFDDDFDEDNNSDDDDARRDLFHLFNTQSSFIDPHLCVEVNERHIRSKK